MFRFIALAWHPGDSAQCLIAGELAQCVASSRTGWRASPDFGGLQVFHADARAGSSSAHLIEGNRGIVLGTLFKRGSCPRAVDDVLDCITGPRCLLELYWGRYVAFLCGGGSARKCIVRDPMGGLPCFHTSFRGVSIAFSQVGDCVELRLPVFNINWRYVCARVCRGPLHVGQTALEGVTEVRAGECLDLARIGAKPALHWDPSKFVQSNVIEDPSHAAVELRSVAKSCIHAWASCYDGILHELSGGLDSAIVLGCLQDAPTRPRITCQVYYYKDGHSDGRAYARLAASRADCELIERGRSANGLKLPALLRAAPSVNPDAHLAFLEVGRFKRRAALGCGATGYFSGEGGDALFCRHGKDLAVADFVQRNGMRRELMNLAVTAASLINTSVWRVVRDALRDGYGLRSVDSERGVIAHRSLFTPDALQGVTADMCSPHPWAKPSPQVPPGKLLQIRALLLMNEMFYDPLGGRDDPEEVYPLRSQPLVELCLGIPNYLQLADGRDRGLARRAFEPDVPREVLDRCWKGGAGNLARRQLIRNLTFVRELLLDGMLVRERLLDRRRLEQSLAGQPVSGSASMVEIFDHVIVESWLQRCSTFGRRADRRCAAGN